MRIFSPKLKPQHLSLILVLAVCDKTSGFGLQFGHWVSKSFAITAIDH